MVLSNFIQFYVLLYSLISGFITGILFDIYRVIRGLELTNKIISFIEDILFFILAAIIIFIFLLRTSDAIMGMYVYAFMAIGVYLYFKLFSNKLVKGENVVFREFLKIARIIINTITYPFRLLFNKLFNK